jgi:uncharacterized protein (TIGR02246 family)
MKKTILLLAVAAAFITKAAFAQSETAPSETAYSLAAVAALVTRQPAADEEAIKGVMSTLEKGWNSKSGETFSSVFADVHDYIVINGLYFSGFTTRGNAGAHQGLFNGVYKSKDIKIKVDKIAFLRSDLALVTAYAGMYETGGTSPKDPSAIMTVIVEKKNDAWKIISFHNHSLDEVLAMKQTPVPMNVMYASWYK